MESSKGMMDRPELLRGEQNSRMTTMLSPAVHQLVCEFGICGQEVEQIRMVQNKLILDDCCSLDWVYLDQLLCDSSSVENIDDRYKASVKTLSVAFAAVEEHMMRMATQSREKLVAKCSWTGNEKVFEDSWNLLLESDSQHNTVLALLKMSATLERVLGDVYLIKSKPVPSLLKDLLASLVLKDIFGKIPMALLDVLIGPPTSLNLRNLVWHGFVSPMELPKRYCLFLLSIIAGMGDILAHQNLHIARRKLIPLSQYWLLNIFPVLDIVELEKLQTIGMSCFLFPEPTICWTDAFVAVKHKRCLDAVTLLCPLLENTLRRIFVLANGCPLRLLTAESSVLYTTFNEILSERIDDVDNQIRNTIGDSYLIMLFDLLILPDGPRLRDRLSHGEVDSASITLELVTCLLCTAVAACVIWKRLLHEHTSIEHVSLELATVQNIMDVVAGYKSLYSSQSLLFHQEMIVINKLNALNTVFVVISEKSATEQEKVCYVNDITLEEPFATLLTEVACIVWKETHIFQFHVSDYILHGIGNSDQLKDFLSSAAPKVLYRPQEELDLISSLRQISTSTRSAVEAMQEVLQTRYDQYLCHDLRSRQRATYQRMVEVLPLVCSSLRFVLLLLIADTICLCLERHNLWITKSRVFRLLRRFVENLPVMTNIKKNRWNEARRLTEDFITSLHRFLKQPQ